jgi:uncharacterized membrane protein
MKPTNWFITIILYTVITLICAYFVPSGSALVVFSGFFGFTFVAFIPGYCFISLIFPEGKLDLAEKAVLSVALSFSIAGVSGLFLGLSPIGINLRSITYALSTTVVILAALTLLKKMNLLNFKPKKLKHKPQNK